MDVMTCPHCRRPADRPMVFPRAQQQVFDYIWNHPWCEVKQIEKALYGPNISSRDLVAVHISKIRANLADTGFSIITRSGARSGRRGFPSQYRIVEVPTNANV